MTTPKIIWKPISEVSVIVGGETGTGNTLELYPKANALIVQHWGGEVYWKRNSSLAGSSDGFRLVGDYQEVLWYNYEDGDYISYWVEPGATLVLQFGLG
jgi:hypothetical protein